MALYDFNKQHSLAVVETYIIYDQIHDRRCVGYNMLMMLVVCC